MKLVILDRDGTINHDSDAYIKSPEEWLPIDGALEAIALLNQAGWHVVIATNQAAISRGLFPVATLDAIHEKMHEMARSVGAKIDAVFYCPHKPEDACSCRKPKPGLLFQVAEQYQVDLTHVPMVGDTLRDMQAAAAAGCQPHLVLTGKEDLLREQLKSGGQLPEQFPGQTKVHANLMAFAQYIVSNDAQLPGAAN